MDGGDQWNTRLSASSKRFQSRSEFFLGVDDVAEVEDDYKQEFICPFCADEFDIVGLFCHIDEEHQMEVRNGVCPVCAKKVGMDMVGHVTMQHANILKIQRKRRLRRGGPTSMFSILRKELRDVNRQSLLGNSSYGLAASNPDPDPLLSSFMYSSPVPAELKNGEPHSSADASSTRKTFDENNEESAERPQLSVKEQEEKARKCEFVQGLLLSTILDDIE